MNAELDADETFELNIEKVLREVDELSPEAHADILHRVVAGFEDDAEADDE